MKTILQLIILIFLASVCKAQVLIILKDGNEINAKVIEVNLADIKYKKFDNPEGPSYSVQKSGVFMIKYKNGTKDIDCSGCLRLSALLIQCTYINVLFTHNNDRV